jgi:hypothetical protein
MSMPGKTILILFFILCCSSLVYASDISDSFTKKYNSMIPAENSSVQSDYLYEQIALGSQYTILMLDQLTTGNESLSHKTDIMIEKFNILIEQNKKIIELLKRTKDSGS